MINNRWMKRVNGSRWLPAAVAVIMTCAGLPPASGAGLIFSQYVETDSGTVPKGVEVWNNTGAGITFNDTDKKLVIEQGANGAVPSETFSLNTGTLAAGSVLVIGTTNMTPDHVKAFTFNGNDALVLKLGGVTNDVIGLPGSDPGTAWTSNGVSTANQNIQLKDGITAGDTDGWTDPSVRFETVSSTPSQAGGLAGFGVAPGGGSSEPALQVSPSTVSGLTYLLGAGPSTAKSYTLSGSNLEGSGNLTVTAPADFEIATSAGGTYGSSLSLPFAAGQLTGQPVSVFVRLAAGRSLNSYSGNITHAGGGVASPPSVALSGSVTDGSSTSSIIFSQYVETEAGSIPKGVEVWNTSGSTIDFSVTQLVIEQGANGAVPSETFSLNTGTLAAGSVLVIGTTNMTPDHVKAFTFNGNDALVLKLGGVTNDVIGLPGSDPGTAWTSNGVSTANQNIQLKDGITAGDPDGWTDPSARFETVSTTPSQAGGLAGFGVAPGGGSSEPALQVSPSTVSGLDYLLGAGPSTAKSYTLSGSNLEGSGNIAVTVPADFEIATSAGGTYGGSLSLPFASGQLTGQPVSVFVRLAAGRSLNSYSGNITHAGGGVASPPSVALSGSVTDGVTNAISLAGGSYTQNFNGIGSGLPSGVRVVTGATIGSSGTNAIFNTAAISWGDASGAFKNLASTTGLTDAATTGEQSGSADRALGIRTTGSFGDPGSGFIFTIRDTLGYENITVSMDLLMLSVQTRSQVWTLDYRVGTSGNFTPLGTWSDTGAWGATPVSATMGAGARNQAQPVEVRVVCLTAATGGGSRDTIAIDNLVLTAQSTRKPTLIIIQ